MYDGYGRRVQIVELTNNVPYATNKFIWDGQTLAEQRDLTGAVVTKRFFGEGEQVSGTNYYFTRDHLGSVREVMNMAGVMQARYDYDPYGRMTVIAGTFTADCGYAGMYYHAPSGLNLTLYRAYDSDLGRWLNRDPIQELGGLNLYAYAMNNPVNDIDLLGLEPFRLLIAEDYQRCQQLAMAISQQDSVIENAIQSMSEITVIYYEALDTQVEAAAIEGVEAIYGGKAMSEELSAYEAAPYSYQEGLKTAVIVGGVSTVVDETKDHMIGWTSITVSGWNLLNVDETMAEREEKMAETMSETTYQTKQELQNVLRTMIDTYNADCCPNQ